MVADEVGVVATAVEEDTAEGPTLRRSVVVEGAGTVVEEEAVATVAAGKGVNLEKQEHQRYPLTL